jgi:hypothetical protein
VSRTISDIDLGSVADGIDKGTLLIVGLSDGAPIEIESRTGLVMATVSGNLADGSVEDVLQVPLALLTIFGRETDKSQESRR